jgi:hypothetical protein
MLKKDNWILGIILGGVAPVVIYFALQAGIEFWASIDKRLHPALIENSTLLLVGIFINMFTFRYYMVNLRFDKTGRGILLATFVYAGYFLYKYIG